MKVYSNFVKGGQFYRTTWETSVVSNEKYDDNRNKVITRYKYVGKEAIDKADDYSQPVNGMTYDNAIQDRRKTFEATEYVWTNNNTFRFGKYRGSKIKNVNDLNYTAWYWKNISGEHKEWVKDFLEDSGCEFRGSGDSVFVATPEIIQKEQEEQYKKDRFIDRLNRNNTLQINNSSNYKVNNTPMNYGRNNILFNNVSIIDISTINWKNLIFNRNNNSYKSITI